MNHHSLALVLIIRVYAGGKDDVFRFEFDNFQFCTLIFFIWPSLSAEIGVCRLIIAVGRSDQFLCLRLDLVGL